MKKQDLTNDEQTVLSYIVLIDAYVKRNNTSDDEDSLCDRFAQVFYGMDENGDAEQLPLFYNNLISLNEKNYIDFEGASYPFDDDMRYEFDSLEISKKGADYVRRYMKLDKKELKISMRKIPRFSWSDIADACKQINNSEVFKLFAALVSAIIAILALVIK